ncbi:MAG: ABC transporter ATP-binding protein [Planctomycetes bacterium]|jgi:ABC-type nitrate/sulfonate/bicarbonate transport system ATPase subunit|nr:ABC transporter ATP-binding protein [Planctomycetota bacterium]
MIKVVGINKSYSTTAILQNISFNIPDGQIIALFGPNGCGKTTLLKIIAGLDKQDSGEIKQLERSDDSDLRAGLVFQDHRFSLLPWMTIYKNIELTLISKIKSKKEREKRVDQIIDRLNLSRHQNKYPYQVSGGLSQLTAFGRALAFNPDIYLFDEPFSALDYQSALKLQQQFLSLWEKEKKSTIIVTHSIEEVILLADQIIIFSGLPAKILDIIPNNIPRPRNLEQLGGDLAQGIRQKIISIAQSFLI